jgi:hypothetical protein
MTRTEIESRLIELERAIEQHRTSIWLAEFEREQLRTELRRHLQAESNSLPLPPPQEAK